MCLSIYRSICIVYKFIDDSVYIGIEVYLIPSVTSLSPLRYEKYKNNAVILNLVLRGLNRSVVIKENRKVL